MFCQVLKEVRIKAGLSQYKLADILGTTQSWISKCERGERRIDVVELRMFCQAFQISSDEFMKMLERALKEEGAQNNRRQN